MINVAIYQDGVLDAIGLPCIFLKEEDFDYVLLSDKARKDLISQFGKGICIGCLGKLTPRGYVENEIGTPVRVNENKGDMSFYEKL